MKKIKSRVETIGMLPSTEGEATHYLENGGGRKLFFRQMSFFEQLKFDGSFIIQLPIILLSWIIKLVVKKNGKT